MSVCYFVVWSIKISVLKCWNLFMWKSNTDRYNKFDFTCSQMVSLLFNSVRCPCNVLGMIVSPSSVHCYLLTYLLTYSWSLSIVTTVITSFSALRGWVYEARRPWPSTSWPWVSLASYILTINVYLSTSDGRTWAMRSSPRRGGAV